MSYTPAKSFPPPWFLALQNRRMLICIFTGFASGLPFFLQLNLLPAWLKTEGLSLESLALFALAQLPYAWKFLWAPLLDRYAILSLMGRRRSWMLLSQLGLIAAIAYLGQLSPTRDLVFIAILTIIVAFLSATQDIAVDAFRREILSDHELGMGNALHVNAYRIAGLVPGSLSLILADYLPWGLVFLITALFMIPGLIMTLLVREPAAVAGQPRTLKEAVIEPFVEFFSRHGCSYAALVLTFLFCYKLGDSLCTSLATPFYLDMGFSTTDIGIIAKNIGLWSSIGGGLAGGIWMVRLGINRALWIFGIFQAVTILGFIWLAWLGPAPADWGRRWALAIVLVGEYGAAGLGTVAYIAFMARLTHPAYTATQLALFTSLMALPRASVNASSGWLVSQLGWVDFFCLCLLLAIPGMLLLHWVAPWRQDKPLSSAPPPPDASKESSS